jgi:hypothetical protein
LNGIELLQWENFIKIWAKLLFHALSI